MPNRHSGLQGVLLDQFGVLHDGKVAYPGAVDAVQRWAQAGVRVYILSNSSRRAAVALDKIESLGFAREWFAGVRRRWQYRLSFTFPLLCSSSRGTPTTARARALCIRL